MNFEISAELLDLRERTKRFIAEQVIPLENDVRETAHGPSEALRQDLVARARAAGLLTPHASVDMGGLGLSHVAKAVMFEEAGYSRLGPTALNIHAPDEGNIHLMELVADAGQKERWLRPQVQGLMTAPVPTPACSRPWPCAMAMTTSSTAASGSSPGLSMPATSSSWPAWKMVQPPCS